MPNTLDGMMPDIYKAMALVGRTPIGLIGAVNTNSGAEQAAVGEVVKVPVATVAAAQDIAPSMSGDATKGNASVGFTPITLTKQREVPINWNGEETKGIQNGGMFENVTQQQFYLAFKALSEEVESDIAAALKVSTLGSHIYGTAGTTPFGTAGNLSDIAELARIRRRDQRAEEAAPFQRRPGVIEEHPRLSHIQEQRIHVAFMKSAGDILVV